MKTLRIALAALLLALIPASASAWDIKDLLSKGKDKSETASKVGNLLEDVFTRSKLEVKDLAGEWKVEGSAVNFKSENVLKQIGGRTGASVIEKKLDPWYKKLGMTGGTLTIDKDGSFTLQLKRMKVTGKVEKAADSKDAATGNFIFRFNKFGTSNMGECEAFVTKGMNKMDVMFDASRLQDLMNGIASFSKLKLASAASSLLSSYDGICVGFALKK